MLWPAPVAVVANVMVEVGVTAFSESAVRNTSAKAGAGTGIVQVLAFWSHWIVVTFSVPFIRPSDFKESPSVCGREKDCHEHRSNGQITAKMNLPALPM